MILMEHADWHKPGEPAQTIVSPLWRPKMVYHFVSINE
jgi:hypothetical protein